ncbi:MAG: substrate-binding domain-containing protein [Planctomycetota bacterium]|jgi:ribose transport system substrate-binding protein
MSQPLRRPTSFLLALALGLTCAPMTACGGGAEAGEERLEIAVVPKGTAHEFWKSVHAGALHGAAGADVDILWSGPEPEGDRDAQIKVVENLALAGVDALVLMPVDAEALVPAARKLERKGIPVIVADSDLSWDGRTSFVATDNRAAGRLAGEHLVSLLGGEGDVILLRYVVGSASTQAREEGFLEALEGQAGIRVVSSDQYAGVSKADAQSAAENLLARFPGVDGVFCPNESAAFGMLRALEDAREKNALEGEVRFVGFDASPNLLTGLESGAIDALVLQDPVRMGQLAVEVAAAALAGEEVEARVDTGVTLATPENLNEPEIRALLEPDLSILDR